MSQSMRDLGMEIAREQASQAWQGIKTSGKEMDADLAEEFARIIYTWIVGTKGAEMQSEYYRGILGQVTQRLGCLEEARFANVPGRVASLVSALEQMAAHKTRLEARLAQLAAPTETGRLRQLAVDQNELEHRKAP